MTDIRPRQDSSRDLLEELEDGWATPTAPGVRRSDPKVSAAPSHGDEATSEVAGDASEETEAEAAPTSSPNLDRLDEGWLDELFDEDEDDEDDDDDDSDADSTPAPTPIIGPFREAVVVHAPARVR